MLNLPQITVGQIMTRNIVTVSMDDSLRMLRELFASHSFHHLLVVDAHKLVGVISDRDLLRNISPFVGNDFTERPQDLGTLNRKAHQIMSRAPITAGEDLPLADAARLILDRRVSCLPIVDQHEHPVGILTWHDILRALVAETDAPACG